MRLHQSGPPPEAVSTGRHLLAVIVIALVVGAALIPSVMDGLVYASQDTAGLNYTALRSHVEGDGGWWAEGIFTGFPKLADPTFALFSIRSALFHVFAGYGAQVACVIFLAFVAGLGAYLAGLEVTRFWPAALLAGVVWPLSGFVAGMPENIPYMASAAWMPWAVRGWMMRGNGLARMAWTALFLAVISLGGDPFGMGVAAASLLLVSLASPISGVRTVDIGTWLLAVGLALLVSAVSWYPALYFSDDSVRAGGITTEMALAYSLHPVRLLNLLGPRFFGMMAEGSFWGGPWAGGLMGKDFWFNSVYLGLVVPVLVGAAIVRRHRGRGMAFSFLVTAAVLTVISFGWHLPGAEAVVERLGALMVFRFPAKLFAPAGLFLLLTACLGLRPLAEAFEDDDNRKRASLLVFAVLAAATVALLSLAGEHGETIRTTSPNPALSFLRVYQDLVRAGLFAAALPILLYVLGTRFRAPALAAAILVIAAADMLTAQPAHQLRPEEDFDAGSVIAEKIKQTGPGRLIVADDIYYYMKTGRRNGLAPNWGLLEGVDYAFGKSAARPYLLDGLNTREALSENGDAPFRLLAARYVLAAMEPKGKWVERLLREGVITELESYPSLNLSLYRTYEEYPEVLITHDVEFAPSREDALKNALHEKGPAPLVYVPREMALMDGEAVSPAPLLPETGPESPLEYARYTSGLFRDRMTVEAKLESAGLLVLRQRAAPGWHALVAGKETPIYYADGAWIGVSLDRGSHMVEFSFSPGPVKASVWVSMLSAVMAAVLLLVGFRKEKAARK